MVEVSKLRRALAEQSEEDRGRDRQRLADAVAQLRPITPPIPDLRTLFSAEIVARQAFEVSRPLLEAIERITSWRDSATGGLFSAYRPLMDSETALANIKHGLGAFEAEAGRQAFLGAIASAGTYQGALPARSSGLTVVEAPAIVGVRKNRGGRPRRWGGIERLVNYLALTLGHFVIQELSAIDPDREPWGGITQTWAAEKLGVPWPTVRDWPKSVGSTWAEVRDLVEDQVFRQLSVSSSDSDKRGAAITLGTWSTAHARIEAAH